MAPALNVLQSIGVPRIKDSDNSNIAESALHKFHEEFLTYSYSTQPAGEGSTEKIQEIDGIQTRPGRD